jgi:hypothetical protein
VSLLDLFVAAKNDNNNKQNGTELCEAQFKLGLPKTDFTDVVIFSVFPESKF